VPVLVALVTLAAFLPTLQNGFVSWDDDENLLTNAHYRGLGWTHLHWMWTTFHVGHYMPLTWMTLGLDYVVWGMNALGYHLTSLVLHATNALLFYFVVRRILGLALPWSIERPHPLGVCAGFAALLFAIHPLRVESVAWATERRDVLSGLFYLLTILTYLRSAERPESSRAWYWFSVALFGCALLSKSIVVSLPVVLLILDVYPLRRLGGAAGWWSERARIAYTEKIPFVLLAAAASAVAFTALVRLHNMATLAELSIAGRLAVSAYGLSFYLVKTVVPWNLSPLYALQSTVNPWAMSLIMGYGVVLAIALVALARRRRWPGLPAVWIAYVVALLPVLGIFQNGPQITADRYSYLAGLGWATLAGGGLLSWSGTAGKSKSEPLSTPLVAATVIVVTLGVLTWQQVQVWHDSATLWSYAVSANPDSSVAHGKVGDEMAIQGKLAEAIDHYREVIRLKPDDAEGETNLGAMLVRLGKPAGAIEHFQRALRLRPDLAAAEHDWAMALESQNKVNEAIEHLRQALRLKPDFAEAHTSWGLTLARRGNLAEALEHFQQAVRLRPDNADARTNLGAALLQQGKPAEAIEHFQHAVRLQPESAVARSNLSVALAEQRKRIDPR